MVDHATDVELQCQGAGRQDGGARAHRIACCFSIPATTFCAVTITLAASYRPENIALGSSERGKDFR